MSFGTLDLRMHNFIAFRTPTIGLPTSGAGRLAGHILCHARTLHVQGGAKRADEEPGIAVGAAAVAAAEVFAVLVELVV
jgi:hypothetical protein